MNQKNKILVAYITVAGSTKEVAERIAVQLEGKYGSVDCRPITEIGDLESYTGAVIGGPMILGWHKKAVKFVKKHRSALANIRYHVFMTAAEVTGEANDQGILVDPGIQHIPVDGSKLTFKERNTTVPHYTAPISGKKGITPPGKIAIFGGKVDFTKLKFFMMLFEMLIVRTKPGDRRNWDLIEEWAKSLDFA